VVIFGHLTLTFVNLDQHAWLVISVGCEGLLLLGWDRCVSWDKNSHDTSCSFNAL